MTHCSSPHTWPDTHPGTMGLIIVGIALLVLFIGIYSGKDR